MSPTETATLGRARLSFASEADIDEFVAALERYERGEMSADAWRAFRLVRGTYGQRQLEDAQMLRVKIPQGVLAGHQLEALADVAERYSRGFGHVTTRQNVQFHFVKLHDVEPAMRLLADAGLTTREACGNAVRNVTACPYAGVAGDEAFDVTPYAEALTRYLLRHPLSSTLPRKFKIAFEGCPQDHVATAVNDIGWRAQVRTIDGREVRGFRVTAGGGTAILCTSGGLLFDFLPAGQILYVAEAILRVFNRLGDRKHRQRNRMKFLIRQIGWDRFLAEFNGELETLRSSGSAGLPFDPDAPDVEGPPLPLRGPAPAPERIAGLALAGALRGPGFHPRVRTRLKVQSQELGAWLTSNARRQKQPGYAAVTITLPLGDITAAQLRLVADLAGAYGDGSVRATPEQNLLLRWVPLEDLPELYERLAAAGLGEDGAATAVDVTSCPGAETCRLAVTQSRGLARTLADGLRGRPEIPAALPGVDIKISGCPNGCGLHHIAGIGFQGSIRKVAGRAAPHYFLMLGGGVDERAAFGRHAATVPARRCSEALARVTALYEAHRRPDERPREFFARVELGVVKQALADIAPLTPDTATPEDFIDLGDAAQFRPEVLDGECSA